MARKKTISSKKTTHTKTTRFKKSQIAKGLKRKYSKKY